MNVGIVIQFVTLNGILTYKNLYNYHVCIETLKILKSKVPFPLFKQYTISSRNNMNFILLTRDASFSKTKRINIWNSAMKIISNRTTIVETSVAKFKKTSKISPQDSECF